MPALIIYANIAMTYISRFNLCSLTIFFQSPGLIYSLSRE